MYLRIEICCFVKLLVVLGMWDVLLLWLLRKLDAMLLLLRKVDTVLLLLPGKWSMALLFLPVPRKWCYCAVTSRSLPAKADAWRTDRWSHHRVSASADQRHQVQCCLHWRGHHVWTCPVSRLSAYLYSGLLPPPLPPPSSLFTSHFYHL